MSGERPLPRPSMYSLSGPPCSGAASAARSLPALVRPCRRCPCHGWPLLLDLASSLALGCTCPARPRRVGGSIGPRRWRCAGGVGGACGWPGQLVAGAIVLDLAADLGRPGCQGLALQLVAGYQRSTWRRAWVGGLPALALRSWAALWGRWPRLVALLAAPTLPCGFGRGAWGEPFALKGFLPKSGIGWYGWPACKTVLDLGRLGLGGPQHRKAHRRSRRARPAPPASPSPNCGPAAGWTWPPR
jgi:hypothetical protein